MKSSVRLLWCLACLVAFLAAAGCPGGKGGYTVKGKLTHGGQPVASDSSTIVSLAFYEMKDGGMTDQAYDAIVEADGSFTIEDIPAGNYRVAVKHWDNTAQKDKLEGKFAIESTANKIEKEVTGSTDDLNIDLPAS